VAGVGNWDRTANEAGWTALLGSDRGGPDVSPYAAPARATDLSGLPPAFIDVGSAETFRDEDIAYASRIWQAGGVAELHVWPGGFHGFDVLAPTPNSPKTHAPPGCGGCGASTRLDPTQFPPGGTGDQPRRLGLVSSTPLFSHPDAGRAVANRGAQHGHDGRQDSDRHRWRPGGWAPPTCGRWSLRAPTWS